jgi:hypothetical protein
MAECEKADSDKKGSGAQYRNLPHLAMPVNFGEHSRLSLKKFDRIVKQTPVNQIGGPQGEDGAC